MFRQIGNAVPCRLAFVVAKAVQKILLEVETGPEPVMPKELLKLVSG